MREREKGVREEEWQGTALLPSLSEIFRAESLDRGTVLSGFTLHSPGLGGLLCVFYPLKCVYAH